MGGCACDDRDACDSGNVCGDGDCEGVESVNERRTSGDSSASTVRVRWAVLARWAVGKGMVRVLRLGFG